MENEQGTEAETELMPLMEEKKTSQTVQEILMAPVDFDEEDTPENNLDRLVVTQEKLELVKKSLATVVETMRAPNSTLARAAETWGKKPLWEKISYGVVLTGPTLTISILFNAPLVMSIGLTAGVSAIYTGASFLLDEHHDATALIMAKLTEGVNGLVEVLGWIIGALAEIHNRLSQQVDRLERENNRLTSTVDDLNRVVKSLDNQAALLTGTVELLKDQESQLLAVRQTLSSDVLANAKALKENQQQLTAVRGDLGLAQQNLSKKVEELVKVREEMTAEISKLRTTGAVLQQAVNSLSGTVIADKAEREQFIGRLEAFLADKGQSFDLVAERICDAERRLSEAQAQLDANNARYDKLNAAHEKMLAKYHEKLEVFNGSVTSDNKADSSSAHLSTFFSSGREEGEPMRAVDNLTAFTH